MLLSKACVYGVRASLYMSLVYQEDNYISIRGMSQKLNISFHFLTKILQQITHAGLMHSYKGPNGGINLSKDPREITIIEIIDAIDGLDVFTECVIGLPGCGKNKPCPLHEKWAAARMELQDMFTNTTLHEMAVKSKELNLRLSDELNIQDLTS